MKFQIDEIHTIARSISKTMQLFLDVYIGNDIGIILYNIVGHEHAENEMAAGLDVRSAAGAPGRLACGERLRRRQTLEPDFPTHLLVDFMT